MRQTTKTIILTVILLSLISFTLAIESTLTFKGGVAYPLADVNHDSEYNPMGGISYELWLTKFLSIGISPYASKLEGSEDYEILETKATYTEKFSTNIVGGDLFFKFRPNWRKVTPFVTAGVGILNFFPKDGDGHHIIAYDDETYEEEDYDYTVMVMPALGAGISIFPRENLNIDLGFQRQSVASDYLDGCPTEKEDDAFWMAYLGLGITFGIPKPAPVVVLPPEPEPEPIPEPKLMLNPTTVNAPYTAGMAKVTLDANNPWTVAENELWLTVDPMVGVDMGELVINYDENTIQEDRTGLIYVSSGGLNRTITVIQEMAPPPPPELDLNIEGDGFDFDKAVLKDKQKMVLDKVAMDLMTDFPDVNIEIRGHCSYEGTEAYNMDLSVKRAQATKDYLVMKGVDPMRLTVKGMGETDPIADNSTREGAAMNRRFELVKM